MRIGHRSFDTPCHPFRSFEEVILAKRSLKHEDEEKKTSLCTMRRTRRYEEDVTVRVVLLLGVAEEDVTVRVVLLLEVACCCCSC